MYIMHNIVIPVWNGEQAAPRNEAEDGSVKKKHNTKQLS